MTVKERVVQAIRILKREYEKVTTEELQKLQAILYILAQKFLTQREMEEIKEEFDMTYLGQLIFNDGLKTGKEEGREEGREEGISVQCCSEKFSTCSVSAKRRNPRPFFEMGGVSFFVKKYAIANYQSSLFQLEEYNVVTTPVVSDNTSLTSVCPKNVPVQSPLTLQTIGVGAYCTY